MHPSGFEAQANWSPATPLVSTSHWVKGIRAVRLKIPLLTSHESSGVPQRTVHTLSLIGILDVCSAHVMCTSMSVPETSLSAKHVGPSIMALAHIWSKGFFAAHNTHSILQNPPLSLAFSL